MQTKALHECRERVTDVMGHVTPGHPTRARAVSQDPGVVP